MPRILDTEVPSYVAPQPAYEIPKAPGIGETVGAAFNLENDVVNAVDLLTREQYKAQEGFDFRARVDAEPRWFQSYPNAFNGVRSDAGYDAVVARLRKEEKDRETLAAAGTAGIVAALTAGMLSPTNFIPLIGTGSRGLRAVAEGLASGAAAGAIQGGTLQVAQDARPREDILYDIGGGAVLGGLLGGIAGTLTPSDAVRLSKKLETPELANKEPARAFTDVPEPYQPTGELTIPGSLRDGLDPRPGYSVTSVDIPPPPLEGEILYGELTPQDPRMRLDAPVIEGEFNVRSPDVLNVPGPGESPAPQPVPQIGAGGRLGLPNPQLPRERGRGPGAEGPPISLGDQSPEAVERARKSAPFDSYTQEYESIFGRSPTYDRHKVSPPVIRKDDWRAPSWLSETMGQFKTAQEVAEFLSTDSRIASVFKRPEYAQIAKRVKKLLGDMKVSFHIIRPGDYTVTGISETMAGALISTSVKGRVRVAQIVIREGFESPEVVLHELIHAVSKSQVAENAEFRRALGDIQREVKRYANDVDRSLTPIIDRTIARYALEDPDEVLTFGLTNADYQRVLARVPYKKGQKAWSAFVQAIRRALGLKGKSTALDQVIRLFDKLEPNYRLKPLADGKLEASPIEVSALADTYDPNSGTIRLRGVRGSKRFGVDGLSKWGGKVTESPVVQVIQQRFSKKASEMMARLSNAGLRLEDDVLGAPGGTVENLTKQWYTGMAETIRVLDSEYAKYLYEGKPPRYFTNLQATVRGALSGEKLSKYEFRQEVSRAKRAGANYAGPTEAARVASEIDRLIYEPLKQEAIKVGLLTQKEIDELVGDPEYLNRVYNTLEIDRRKPQFINILKEHYQRKLETEFANAAQKLREQNVRSEELIKDISATPEEVAYFRDLYMRRLKTLEESSVGDLSDQLIELATRKREAKAAGNTDEVKRLREAQRILRESGGTTLTNYEQELADVRRRLRNLSQATVVLEKAREAKLNKIQQSEELQLVTWRRMFKKWDGLKKQLRGVSDEVFAEKAGRLKAELIRNLKSMEAAERRVTRTLGPDGDIAKLFEVEQTQADKWAALARKLEEFDTLYESRQGIRDYYNAVFDEALAAANSLNSRRAVRRQRLEEQARNLDSKIKRDRVSEIRQAIANRTTKLTEKWADRGKEIVVDKGTADFSDHAKQIATEVTDRILGTFNRLPAMDILQGERGPMLARVLDIPSSALESFLENDIEVLSRNYLRTMAADIEMTRAFGRPDAADQFRAINAEFDQLAELAKSDAELERIRQVRAQMLHNLEATVMRVRHTWGIPKDPYGASTRLARVAQNVNTLRFMGSVFLSSVPDLSRQVMNYGITRAYVDGFRPLIQDLKTFNLSAREAFLAGNALDVIMHTRLHQMTDVLENFGRTSKAERALEFATSRIGMFALFDYWTSGMKQLTAVMANAELLEAVRHVVTGQEGMRTLDQSMAFLARSGIGGTRAETIWRLVTAAGGGDRVNGVWLPNTEAWLAPDVLERAGVSADQAQEALRTYRAALNGELDRTIITPGLEKPLWLDSSSLTLRLVGQFRSFSFVSTQKTLMAGLQEGDMAFLQGAMISLAMGMVSYYLWAMAAGGRAYDDMMNAGLDKWADEAIQRSGLMGWFAEAQRVAEAIPATQPYASFSGTRSTRRGGDDLLGVVAGPTLDLASRLTRIIAQADDPTVSTLHTARTLLPFQNVFYARQLFDAVEAANADFLGLPERRQSR